MEQEKQLIVEHKLEDIHSKSLAVCDLVAQGTNLKTALSLQKLNAGDFYRARRDTPDVAKAWKEAQEILADIKMSDLSDLGTQLINEEGLTTNTYNAVSKNERWIVEKLSPNTYGPRPTQQTNSLVQNVQILHTLTDEQILAIANGTTMPEQLDPAIQPKVVNMSPVQQLPQKDKKVLDKPIEAEYTEVSGGDSIVFSPIKTLHDSLSLDLPATNLIHKENATGDPDGVKTDGEPAAQMPQYDLSAFGDLP